ncbi:MAG: 50S ribosomal protein L24 [Chitinophagaceae bacterium]|nr:50S ribosomal protein L24 [Chitinophagaceae bacterium]
MQNNTRTKKLHIRKNDTVKIIAGNSKGKTGKIISILKKEQKAIVQGCNMVIKHLKPTAANTKGGIIKKEAPIHISNIMVVYSGVASRIGRKLDDTGKLKRYSKKGGVFI